MNDPAAAAASSDAVEPITPMHEPSAPAPALPPVPRPVTPRVRRRSWGEMSVRVWMVLTLLIGGVTLYFTATRVAEARRDRDLILNGVDVVATFTMVNGDRVPKRRPRNEAMANCEAVFQLDGRRYDLPIPRLEARPGEFAVVGQPLRIKVDPKDPTARWTEQTVPRPWAQELTVVALLVPLLLLLALVTLWKRWRVISVWRDAPLAPASVVETRHTAVAPRSRVVRFSLVEGSDRRVWSTLIPTRAGVPQQGETVWLLVPPNDPGRSIVAKVYSEEGTTDVHG